MKNPFKRMLWLFLALVGIVALYVGGNIVYAAITDFKPAEKITIEVKNPVNATVTDSVLTFMTWNIGYAGLGNQENFFYDGGTMVRPSKERAETNLNGIISTLKGKAGTDFLLIQEIDSCSKRTYYKDQFTDVSGELKPLGYNAAYAMNYKVDYVPMPLERPWDVLGKVVAGLSTFSRFQPVECTRYQYPGAFPFPKRVFMLDRCMLVQRYKLQNGKDLLVINTHNSAFDPQGILKGQEMAYMRKYLLSEYEKGNYVIVGGDWNQNPPGFANNTFAAAKGITEPYEQTQVKPDFMPADWKYAYDPTTPTNRNVIKAYDPNKTFTTLIDFYLISPNVELLEVKGMDVGFAYSDHQPVLMKAKLKM